LLQKISHLNCAHNFFFFFLKYLNGKINENKWPRICLNSKITSIHTYNINYYSQVALDEKSKAKTKGVSHYGLAIYMKTYLKAKEELWKLKYFTMQKIYT